MSDVANTPFGEAMASVDRWDSGVQRFLDDASMRGLCGKPFDEVEKALTHDIEEDRDHFARRQRDLSDTRRRRVDALTAELAEIDRRLEKANERSKLRQSLEMDAISVADLIGDLEIVIRQKRRKSQSDRVKARLDEIDRQAAAANERLSTEERRVAEQHAKLWDRVVDEFKAATGEARQRIETVDGEILRARERVEPLLKTGVTRTVSGFLLWSGYLSFAAIGSAFAILFHDTGEKQSGLSHVLGIARALLSAFPAHWNLALRLALGSMSIVLGLAAFCALVVILDIALQRFDRAWRSDARRRSRNGNRQPDSQPHFAVRPPGATTEIRRSAYVQLLASAPYILITAVITLFAAAVPQVRTGGNQGSGDAAAATTTTTFIGTVLALLVTASLVMYILKVLDRREPLDKNSSAPASRWTDGWEFLVVPALLVVTTLCATFRGWSFNIWGPVTLVMLFSCLAVAYGVVYSGIYKDITILERRKRHFVEELEELRDWSPPDPDETEEMRSARAMIDDLRRRREGLLTAEWDVVPASEPQEEQHSGFAFWRRPAAREPQPRVSYHEIAVPDEEAAPDEYRERRTLERQLRGLERQQRELAWAPADNIEALQERRGQAETERAEALAALERSEFESRRGIAEFDRHKEMWILRLRTAYEAASLAKPILMRGLAQQ